MKLLWEVCSWSDSQLHWYGITLSDSWDVHLVVSHHKLKLYIKICSSYLIFWYCIYLNPLQHKPLREPPNQVMVNTHLKWLTICNLMWFVNKKIMTTWINDFPEVFIHLSCHRWVLSHVICRQSSSRPAWAWAPSNKRDTLIADKSWILFYILADSSLPDQLVHLLSPV